MESLPARSRSLTPGENAHAHHGTVVNVHVKDEVRALPAASFTAVVMTAEYTRPFISDEFGVNLATFPVTLTVPETGARPWTRVSVKLVEVIVEFCIGSENVAVMTALVLTPVAPPAGVVEVTVGGVTSAGAAVVKVQT